MTTAFAAKLVQVAIGEHDTFGGHHESDDVLAARIRTYWQGIGLAFPGVGTAWSAVFVSWCVHAAGATAAEFAFAAAHAKFVKQAIANAEDPNAVFKGVRTGAAAPALGDILQWNRGGGTFDFAHASKHARYKSHSAIVVGTGKDARGRFCVTIGGNESDTIGRTRVPLDAAGLVLQRAHNPHIAHIVNLK
jgi:hypothetical protein